MPADYDGDGTIDAAVFQSSTGRWLVRPSSTSVTTIVIATLGAGSDVPVPADYDGDGRADVAVVHSGTWQILYSSSSYTSGVTVSWTRDTDLPLPGRP